MRKEQPLPFQTELEARVNCMLATLDALNVASEKGVK